MSNKSEIFLECIQIWIRNEGIIHKVFVPYIIAIVNTVNFSTILLANFTRNSPNRHELFHAVVWSSLRRGKKVKYGSSVTFLCKTSDGLVNRRSACNHFAVNNTSLCSHPLHISQHDTADVHKTVSWRRRKYYHISWESTFAGYTLWCPLLGLLVCLISQTSSLPAFIFLFIFLQVSTAIHCS